MRIKINEKEQEQNSGNISSEANEVAGPGGADLPGGEVTPPQDAAAESEENTETRIGETKMEERQQEGEVEMQRESEPPTSKVEGAEGTEEDDPAKKKSGAREPEEEELSEEEKLQNRLLHLAADFENYKRQTARREQEIRERAQSSLLEELFPVLDNFERAVAAADKTDDVQSLKIGIEYILQQFQEALKNNGVEPIEAVGKPFDPALHDAVEESESEEKPGTVIEDLLRGYLFKGRVLRPSRVRVAK